MNIIKRKDYRLVVVSDLHCGSQVGLTPPEFQGQYISEHVSKHNKFIKIQKSMWNFFSSEIIKLKKESPISICVVNGDAIDGQNPKNSGVEELTTDRIKQVAMAKHVVDFIGANTNIIVAGTEFHTGNSEDFEQVLANQLDCRFENHCWLDINHSIFDLKHHVGSSGIPHGRYTPIAREALWSQLWQEVNLIPKPVNFLIRSHVHYFSLIQNSHISALTTPALQGFGTRFGARKCSGLIDIGFISFDILANKTVIMHKHFADLTPQKAKPIVFI